MIFLYHSVAGRLHFGMEVDGRLPFNSIVEDAHEIAAGSGFGPDAFVTCVIQQDKRYGRFASIHEVIQPLVERASR